MLKYFILVVFIFGSFNIYSQDIFTLEQCIDYGLKNNLQIRQYQLQINQKKYELNRKNLSLLPSLNGMISHGFSFGNSLDYTTYTYQKEQIKSNYFSLNSDFTLFNGLSQLNTIKSARFGYLSSQESFDDISDQVSLNIAANYVEILMNIEKLKNAGKQLELSKNLLERTALLVKVGEENKVKELQLKAQLANDEVSKVDAENQLEQSYLKLKQLLNLDLTKPISIVTPAFDSAKFQDYTHIKIETFLEESIKQLPKVKKASYDFESAKYNYYASLGQSCPRLSLQSSVDTRYASTQKNLQNEYVPFNTQIDNNFGQSLSIGLSIPLFNNYQYRYGIQVAKISMKNNEIILQQTQISARNEVYQAYLLMYSASKKYIAADNNLNAQKLLFEQNNILYEQGLMNFYDWQQARNNLVQAESSFLSSKYDYLYKIKVFEYYKGVPIKL